VSAERLCWWKTRCWRKPVLSLNHVVVLDGRELEGAPALVAIKQLYANHYFEAALGLLARFEDAASGRPLLARFHWFRADCRGGFGWLKRRFVERAARRRLEEHLARLEEAACGPAPARSCADSGSSPAAHR
jgi:hypothetical protein